MIDKIIFFCYNGKCREKTQNEKTGDKTMTLTTYLVDINSITFEQSQDYDQDLINELADLLLKQEGTTQPIIVKKIGNDQYVLVEGEIVLLGAIAAHTKDDYFEMIRVYIQENIDLTEEQALIDKIAKTKRVIKIKSSEVIKKEIVSIDEIITSKETPDHWLIVNGNYIDCGGFMEMADKELELRYENKIDCEKTGIETKIKTEIKTIKDKNYLLEKQAEYTVKLAEIQAELDAYRHFLE